MYKRLLFPNNARAVLTQSLSATSDLIYYAGIAKPGQSTAPNPFPMVNGSIYVRYASDGSLSGEKGAIAQPHSFVLTLVSPTDPDDFEIVHVTETSLDSTLWLRARRGVERTTAKAWPAGTLIEARITDGILSRLMQEPYTGGVVVNPTNNFQGDIPRNVLILEGMPCAPDSRLKADRFLKYSDPRASVGRQIVSRSGNLSIGTLRDWAPGLFGGNYGDVFTLPNVPGVQFSLDHDQWDYTLDTNPNITPSSVADWKPVDVFPLQGDPSDSEGDLNWGWTWDWAVLTPSPFPVNSTLSLGAPCVLSEVGFICTSNVTDVTVAPKVTVKGVTDTGDVTLVDNAEITGLGYRTAHKLPFVAGARLGLIDKLNFKVETSADKEVVGFFYSVAAPFMFTTLG